MEQQVENMPVIKCVSSLNLRTGRDDERVLSDPIAYRCSYCGKKRKLGKGSAVMVKVVYSLSSGVEEEVVFCDKCIDVLADLSRHGPRVINEAHKWQLISRVARVSLVQEDLFCFRCLGRSDTHIFMKFDNLKIPGRVAQYGTIRICSKCAVSYMKMMEQSKVTTCEKYDHAVCEESATFNAVCRGWHTQKKVVQ